MGCRIFISYSQRDSIVAGQVVGRLQQKEHQVWIDRADIAGGMKWRPEIARAITECDCFVILLSGTSVRSEHVEKELALAEEEKKAIIPVEISQATPPPGIKLLLVNTQRIDCINDFESGVAQLLTAVPGAPARAMADAARHDLTLSDTDAEFLGTMCDSASIDSQKISLMEELGRIDNEDSLRGHGTKSSTRRREEIVRQLEELSKRSGEHMDKAWKMTLESLRQIEILQKSRDKK